MIARPHPAVLALVLAGCVAPYPEDPMADEPVVCTLTPEQLAAARDTLLPGLLARAERVTDLPDGVRLQFAAAPGLLAELARVMEQERGCCRFLRFQLVAEPAEGAITLDVTGPPGTREALRAL